MDTNSGTKLDGATLDSVSQPIEQQEFISDGEAKTELTLQADQNEKEHRHFSEAFKTHKTKKAFLGQKCHRKAFHLSDF